MGSASVWDKEGIVDELRELVRDGHSASRMAAILYRKFKLQISRNAVIGKVHRLGLVMPNSSPKRKRPKPKAERRAAPRPLKPRFASVGNSALSALYQADPEPFIPSAEELVIPLAERKSIETLQDPDCRWPIGDPQESDFHFCGKKKVAGLPYCEFHARKAFQPPQPKPRHSIVNASNPMPVRVKEDA